MNVRGTIKQELENSMENVPYLPIKVVSKSIKQKYPLIDVYRIVYHIGLNDGGFAIEKDEETTYIRKVVYA